AERVLEGHVCQSKGTGEWRDVGERVIVTGLDRRVIEAATEAQAGLPVRGQPVGQTDARRDVPPIRFGSADRAAGVRIPAAVKESEGSVGITFGPLRGPRLKA